MIPYESIKHKIGGLTKNILNNTLSFSSAEVLNTFK